jgi:2',3'-cyclic-nucleotide 2'-phosphodiesterase (5'-nucleotidase family)
VRKHLSIPVLAAGLLALAVGATARMVEIRLLHSAELAGQIDIVKGRKGQADSGGVMRLASLVSKLRGEQANTILLDAGGAFFGSPESDILDGQAMAAAMNAIDYDYVTLAVPDFSRGMPSLKRLLTELDAQVLIANMRPLGAGNPLRQQRPFDIAEVDGLRIALIGLTDPSAPAQIYPTEDYDMEWLDSCLALTDIMPRLRAENPDVIVLLASQGLLERDEGGNQIRAIVDGFPSIDVILGGNTHRSLSALLGGRTLYNQPLSKGRELGVVDIVYDTVADRIVDKRAQRLAIAADTPPAAELETLLSKDRALARERLAQPVGEAALLFPPTAGLGELSSGDVLLAAVKTAAKAEVVLLPHLRSSIWPRKLSERDLRDIYPYQDSIATMQLALADIEAIVSESRGPDGRFSLAFCGLVPEGGGEAGEAPLRLCFPDGSRPHGRRLFRVALSSYMLASDGGRYDNVRKYSRDPRAALELRGTAIRDALRNYMLSRNPLDEAGLRADLDAGEDD